MSHSNKSVIGNYSSELCMPVPKLEDDYKLDSVFERLNGIDPYIYGSQPQIYQIQMNEDNCDGIYRQAYDDLFEYTIVNPTDSVLYHCNCEHNESSPYTCISPVDEHSHLNFDAGIVAIV